MGRRIWEGGGGGGGDKRLHLQTSPLQYGTNMRFHVYKSGFLDRVSPTSSQRAGVRLRIIIWYAEQQTAGRGR